MTRAVRAFQMTPDDKGMPRTITALEFAAFLRDPSFWVRLNMGASCILASPFTILICPDTIMHVPPGKVILTFHCGTDHVVAYVSRTAHEELRRALKVLARGHRGLAAAPFSNPIDMDDLDAILANLENPQPTVITVYMSGPGLDDGQAECHLKLNDGQFSTPDVRAAFIALYIAELFADKSKIFNQFKDSLDNNLHTVQYVNTSNGSVLTHPGHTISYDDFECPGDVTLQYTANQNDTMEACEMLLAQYAAGVITASQAFIKNYV